MPCDSSNVSKAREATWSGPSSAHKSETAGGTIAFEVEDLDRLMTDLEGKGVTFKSDIIHSPVCRMAVCLDSEGNSVATSLFAPLQ